MATVRDLAIEVVDNLGIPAERLDDVVVAVREHCQGRYEDLVSASVRFSEAGGENETRAARRAQLCRDVWAALDLPGPYPFD